MSRKSCSDQHIEIEFDGWDAINFRPAQCPLCEAERIIRRLEKQLADAQQESRPQIVHDMGQ